MCTLNRKEQEAMTLQNTDLNLFASKPSPGRRFLVSLGFVLTLFSLLGPASPLTISELMYHPVTSPADPPETGEALEYIELYNEGPETEDLGGYSFVNGVLYTFPQGTLLPPRSFLLVASDPDTLIDHYSSRGVDLSEVGIYGPWQGSLDNMGERVQFAVEGGGILLSFRYNDGGLWPAAADGSGHSLELLSPFYDLNEPESWEISKKIGGTPGSVGRFTIPTFDPVSDLPSIDWTKADFDDSAWATATTPIGYDATGPYPISTELSDMQDTYSSVYLRISFHLDDPAGVQALFLEMFYDDGFVLYLNDGNEVARSDTVGGMPGVPPAYNTTCLNLSPELSSYQSLDITSEANHLVAGNNWLSVHAINTTSSSSDFVISARLIGSWNDTPTVLVDEGAEWLLFKGTKEPVPDEGGQVDPRHHTPGTRNHHPIVINEFLAATEQPDAGDWIELYNRSSAPVALDGMYLSDDADDLARYRIADGVTLEVDGHIAFDREELGFGFSSLGEKIFLTAADMTHVLDAVNYGAQAVAGVSYGRYPDGSDEWFFMPAPSFEGTNFVALEDSIVISEIMYHPITENDVDEYIELFNRGAATVDLSGWRLSKAIDFIFPAGTELAPGQLLVVAKDAAHLQAKYGIANVVGDYEGVLANDGESIRLRDQNGNIVDVVRYYDGGSWPKAADGDGSSLELIDPRDDNGVAAAWAASDESGKSTWTSFAHTSVHQNWWTQPENEFHFFLQHRGETLVDDLSLSQGGSQYLTNGSFESGDTGWIIEGTHVDSFVTTQDSAQGSRSLHIVSSGRGDTYCNRIETNTSPLTIGQSYVMSGQARWLTGSRWLLVRTHAQGMAYAVELQIPERLGSPGQPNPAYAPNRGPSVADVRHSPVLPNTGEGVTIAAHVTDVDGLGIVRVLYRVDGSSDPFTPVTMQETGDPGSGDYTAQIPGFPNGTLIAFYVEARDIHTAVGSFPADPANEQCLFYVGPPKLSNLPVYRILLPSSTRQQFSSRPRMSNHLLPCTFIYDDTEIYYTTGIRFRGSPFIRGSADPVSSKRALRLRFPADKLFHGRPEMNLDTMESGRNPSLQSERIAYWICRKIGIPWSDTRFARVLANGTDHGLYGDVQKVDTDYLSFWFPDDDEGYLYKIDDWFEFDDGGGFRNRDADLRWWGDDKELYRWNYRIRSRDEEDNLQPIIDLMSAANASDAQYVAGMSSLMDIQEVLKEIAVEHIVGNWDSWGYNRGKNNLIYQRPSDGRFVLIPWDIDFVLGSGSSPTDSLTSSGLYGFSRMFSMFGSLYDQIVRDIAKGPLSPGAADGYMDRTYQLLSQEGVGVQSPDSIKSFLAARRSFILGPPVAITTNGGMPLVTTDPNVILTGSAPYDAATMTLNGQPVTPTWTSPTSWALGGVVSYGVNDFTVEIFDSLGDSLGSSQITITVNPFVIHTIRPDTNGVFVEWYSVPRREYTVLGGSSPSAGTVLGMDIKATGPTLGFLDQNAPFYLQRFYRVLIQEPKVEPGLKGEYFSGMNFNTLVLTRVDNVVDFNWGQGSPAPEVPVNNFSVRWTGFIIINVAGSYTFWTDSDDGVRLKVGENTVITNWTDHAPTWDSGSLALAEDTYPIVLEFYENGGGAVMELEYQGPGIPRQTVPTSVLVHDPF
jgi:hypothetical protein